jgi:hypothetical protein
MFLASNSPPKSMYSVSHSITDILKVSHMLLTWSQWHTQADYTEPLSAARIVNMHDTTELPEFAKRLLLDFVRPNCPDEHTFSSDEQFLRWTKFRSKKAKRLLINFVRPNCPDEQFFNRTNSSSKSGFRTSTIDLRFLFLPIDACSPGFAQP